MILVLVIHPKKYCNFFFWCVSVVVNTKKIVGPQKLFQVSIHQGQKKRLQDARDLKRNETLEIERRINILDKNGYRNCFIFHCTLGTNAVKISGKNVFFCCIYFKILPFQQILSSESATVYGSFDTNKRVIFIF